MPFVKRNRVRIHYEVEGQGLPVVFLPGLGGTVQMWNLIGGSGALPDRRLILIDPRGHGRSDKPTDRKAHRIEEYRDDVLAVLDTEHVSKAVLWGISDGSKIGCAFADAYPDRVTALIDHDGIEGEDLCEDPSRHERLDAAQQERTDRGWLLRSMSAFEAYTISPALLNEFRGEDLEMVALELEEWTHWKGALSVLPRLKLPILMLLNGGREKDEIARLRISTAGRAELQVIPGTGHLRICFELQLTIPLIRDFLSRVQPEA
ncbi:MAG TPA: alpha/beta hydrolase [Thermoplasmata archaeon]|nr:alpha/beta hydrolase [Thermoplasmata archaeon]